MLPENTFSTGKTRENKRGFVWKQNDHSGAPLVRSLETRQLKAVTAIPESFCPRKLLGQRHFEIPDYKFKIVDSWYLICICRIQRRDDASAFAGRDFIFRHIRSGRKKYRCFFTGDSMFMFDQNGVLFLFSVFCFYALIFLLYGRKTLCFLFSSFLYEYVSISAVSSIISSVKLSIA
jgi:hypothetical protein